MTLDQIKRAVNAGKTVHWANSRYTVVCDNLGQWLLTCEGGSTVGLTHGEGTILTSAADEFYVEGTRHKAIVIDGHTLGVIMGNGVQVLRASVIRGGSHIGDTTSLPEDASRYRPATKQDFKEFNVMWNSGYEVAD